MNYYSIEEIASMSGYSQKTVRRHIAAKKLNADKKNEENTSSAIPDVKNDNGEIFFTPEAVEKMSRKDVEKNWDSILTSMKHWK